MPRGSWSVVFTSSHCPSEGCVMIRRSEYRIYIERRLSRVSGPFWVLVGVRVRVRGWVGSSPVPRSHQEVLPSSQTRTAYHPKYPRNQIVRQARWWRWWWWRWCRYWCCCCWCCCCVVAAAVDAVGDVFFFFFLVFSSGDSRRRDGSGHLGRRGLPLATAAYSVFGEVRASPCYDRVST